MAMADSKYAFPELDGEDKLIAAVKHIASALGSYKNLTEEARRVLADLGTQLSSITQLDQEKGETISEIENHLKAVEEKVRRCDADRYMIWDIAGVPDDAFEFLNAADETGKLVKRLESLSLDKSEDKDRRDELQSRAHDVLQKAMVRLEEEFKYILVQSRQAFLPTYTPFYSSDTESLDLRGDSIEGSVYKDCISKTSEEIIDLVDKDAIPRLRSIASLMFSSKWDRECIQTFISVRKVSLEECLFALKVDEKLSIEEVLGMSWASWNSKIRRWLHAVRIFVRVFLTSEVRLCDQIFGELGSVAVCVIKASEATISQLLHFGDAISVGLGPQKKESLFPILDMFEMLTDLRPDIEALYFGEEGSSVAMKYHEVLRRLSDRVRAAYSDFESTIASENSAIPKSGGIHPVARYVMNYIKTLADYGETLNVLLKELDETAEGTSSSSSSNLTTTSRHFVSLSALLERILDAKSKLYKNASLQHLFLLNNVHYVLRKAKGSELKAIFGDEWIRKQSGKCHKYAMDYQRASWGSVLLFLNDRGIVSSSSSTSKILIKERLRSFYSAFGEIYKTQTAWTVVDEELREDLRISISIKVIHAYRSFVGRYHDSISDKYVKYSADDLENYLLDLFEGSPKSLQSS